MEKSDLTKIFKNYFTAKQKPELVNLEDAHFISIQGKGNPSEKPFSDRIEALYSTAYAIKFFYKDQGKDFVVSKLEGLWWFDEKKYPGKTIETSSVEVPRSEWEYRLLIRMPDYFHPNDLLKAIDIVVSKKNNLLAENIEYYKMSEGLVVQMLHIGPFETELKSLLQMSEFMENEGLDKNGLHHEIYLSDFRKTEPGKLKTILREPVIKKKNLH